MVASPPPLDGAALGAPLVGVPVVGAAGLPGEAGLPGGAVGMPEAVGPLGGGPPGEPGGWGIPGCWVAWPQINEVVSSPAVPWGCVGGGPGGADAGGCP